MTPQEAEQAAQNVLVQWGWALKSDLQTALRDAIAKALLAAEARGLERAVTVLESFRATTLGSESKLYNKRIDLYQTAIRQAKETPHG